jgi:hypothetical protein
MCKDPLAGVQPGTTKDQACGMFTKCITCNNRQNFFYTSVDNVVHTLLWNDALNKAYDQGKIQKTGEWRAWAQFIRVNLLACLVLNLVFFWFNFWFGNLVWACFW